MPKNKKKLNFQPPKGRRGGKYLIKENTGGVYFEKEGGGKDPFGLLGVKAKKKTLHFLFFFGGKNCFTKKNFLEKNNNFFP